MLADVHGFLRLALGPPDLRKLECLILMAVGARYPVVTLIAIGEGSFNPTAARNLRSRDHENLSPSERASPRHGEINRIAFPVHISWIGVHFIAKQVPRRHGPESDRAIGAGHY